MQKTFRHYFMMVSVQIFHDIKDQIFQLQLEFFHNINKKGIVNDKSKFILSTNIFQFSDSGRGSQRESQYVLFY